MSAKYGHRENGKPDGKRDTWRIVFPGKTYVFPVRRSKNRGGGALEGAVADYVTSNKILNIKKETSSYTPISLQAGGRISKCYKMV